MFFFNQFEFNLFKLFVVPCHYGILIYAVLSLECDCFFRAIIHLRRIASSVLRCHSYYLSIKIILHAKP